MLKIVLFAFLSCGVVSAASAMSVWMVQPSVPYELSGAFFTARDFDKAFTVSVSLIFSFLATIYWAVRS